MRTNIKAWITSDGRKWVLATIACESGEVWRSPADYGIRPYASDPVNYCDTSDHITIYLSGEWRVHHPGYPPVTITGLSPCASELLTGDKHKRPNKAHTVDCIQAGEVFHLIPKGAVQPDLDYKLLFPGESTTIPSAGWRVVLEGGAYTATEVTGLVNAASAVSPTLVFWEK